MPGKIYGKIRNGLKGLFPDFFDKINKHKLVVKYIITGVSTATLDFIFLFAFTEYVFRGRYIISAIFAFGISLTFAFFVQKYWTFADYSHENVHGQLFNYFLTVIFIMCLNLLLLFLLVEFVHVHYLLAQLVALCVTGVVGFVINVRHVFYKSYYPKGVAIAAGIFPPDVGGPATYIYRLVNEIAKIEVRSTVVTYSRLRHDTIENGYDVIRINARWPLLVRGITYLVFLFIAAVNYPVIFAQDLTSTGLLAMVVKKFLPQKKLVIRVGGDLLWERKVEAGKTKLSIADFYRSGRYKRDIVYRIGQMVLNSADQIIVPALFLKDIYVRYYKIPEEKIDVIKNPLPDINLCEVDAPSESVQGEKTILFAGRFLKLKNVDRLIKAFIVNYDAIKPARLVLIGEGSEEKNYREIISKWQHSSQISILPPLLQPELFGYIRKANLCVCPSLSEVNPNFILE
ncbi:MAG: GtrA family protein, partial [Candidatus Vogelbacteria bacterium]|nr:GtrA family protein [Candidatus Vogelbacteria bacterium]